jgi:hypothetical protein
LLLERRPLSGQQLSELKYDQRIWEKERLFKFLCANYARAIMKNTDLRHTKELSVRLRQRQQDLIRIEMQELAAELKMRQERVFKSDGHEESKEEQVH